MHTELQNHIYLGGIKYSNHNTRCIMRYEDTNFIMELLQLFAPRYTHRFLTQLILSLAICFKLHEKSLANSPEGEQWTSLPEILFHSTVMLGHSNMKKSSTQICMICLQVSTIVAHFLCLPTIVGKHTGLLSFFCMAETWSIGTTYFKIQRCDHFSKIML